VVLVEHLGMLTADDATIADEVMHKQHLSREPTQHPADDNHEEFGPADDESEQPAMNQESVVAEPVVSGL
ncbi:MAG: hypothetical protein ACOC0P_05115, partial [Planctomycetota bacterium]